MVKKIILSIFMIAIFAVTNSVDATSDVAGRNYTDDDIITSTFDLTNDEIEITILTDIEAATILAQSSGKSVSYELKMMQKRRDKSEKGSKLDPYGVLIPGQVDKNVMLSKTYKVNIAANGSEYGYFKHFVMVDILDLGSSTSEIVTIHGVGCYALTGGYSWQTGLDYVYSSGDDWVKGISVGTSELTLYYAITVGLSAGVVQVGGSSGGHYIYRIEKTFDTTFRA